MSAVSGRAPRPAGLVPLFLCCVLADCGFHSDTAAVERLRDRIHEQVGTDSAITVRSFDGAKTVTVQLAHFPVGDSKQVEAQVEALVKAELPKTSYVVVGRL